MTLAPTVQRATLFSDKPFVLQNGESLTPLEVSYETYGTLNADRSNAILVLHALTGDSHVSAHHDGDAPGWWQGVVGPGKLLDTDRYFVLCSNILGSCYGTTGPETLKPGTEQPWGVDFPYPIVRDVVRVQKAWLDHLGIDHLALVVGGSLGGQQALQWAVEYPDFMDGTISIACSEKSNAWVIALQDVGRQAIHHALKYPELPELLDQALATARMLAMISYRTPHELGTRFQRLEVDPQRRDGENLRFEVESYLRYQGEKLVARFEAHSYLRLTRMLDSFDVGAGYDSVDAALSRIKSPVCLVGIDSDILFDCRGPQRLAGKLRNLGVDAEFKLLTSIYGHDGFLIENELLTEQLRPFLARVNGASAA